MFVFSLTGKGGSVSNKVARSADKFKFEDIFSGRFSPEGYTCDWISGKFSICIHVYQNVCHTTILYSFWIGGIFDASLILLVVMSTKFETLKLNSNKLIRIIIISDNEYITSGKDGLVLKDVAHDETFVLLDPKKKVNTRF